MKSSLGKKSLSIGPWSRRCMHTFPDSRSRGPISILIGAPFLTHSHFFNTTAQITTVNVNTQGLISVSAITA